MVSAPESRTELEQPEASSLHEVALGAPRDLRGGTPTRPKEGRPVTATHVLTLALGLGAAMVATGAYGLVHTARRATPAPDPDATTVIDPTHHRFNAHARFHDGT